MNYKIYLRRLFICCSMFMILVGGINYIVDPANLFHREAYIKGMASLVLAGNNVTNIRNFDERLLQKYILQETDYKEVIVLGSSRVMTIPAGLEKGKSFHNYGVSGASLEDDIAILSLCIEKNILPKKIIIGLDPWLLNKNNGQNRWESLRMEYQRGLKYIGVDDPKKSDSFFSQYSETVNPYKQMFNFGYLKESIKEAYKIISSGGVYNHDYYVTVEEELEGSTILADGSRTYDAVVRNVKNEQVQKQAAAYIAGNIYSLEHFQSLDENMQTAFEGLIQYLKDHHVEIVFYFPPYHPDVYEYLSQNTRYGMVQASDQYFRGIAEKHAIKTVGNYDPIQCGLNGNDFFDGMHMRKSSVVNYLQGKL